jgi:hypothetical protein
MHTAEGRLYALPTRDAWVDCDRRDCGGGSDGRVPDLSGRGHGAGRRSYGGGPPLSDKRVAISDADDFAGNLGGKSERWKKQDNGEDA